MIGHYATTKQGTGSSRGDIASTAKVRLNLVNQILVDQMEVLLVERVGLGHLDYGSITDTTAGRHDEKSAGAG